MIDRLRVGFLINPKDSRHAQLSIYAVFDEESNFQVKNKEIRRPEAKTLEKRT